MQLFFGIEREPPRLRPPGLAWDWIFSSVVELKKDIVWRSTRRINCNFYMYLEFAIAKQFLVEQRLRLEMKFCFCYSFCGFLYTLATCPGGKTGGLHIFIPLHFLQGEKVENYCLNEWPYDVIEIWNVHRKEKENKASGNSYQALCTLMMPISLKDDWFVRTQCRSQYQIRIIRGEIRQQARTAQPKEIITFLALETGDIWVMTCPHIIFGALVVVATSFDGEKWPNLW